MNLFFLKSHNTIKSLVKGIPRILKAGEVKKLCINT